MIVLPIEVKARELKSKLLIASHILDYKMPVLIGHDVEINNSSSIKNSTFLLKSAATFENDLVEKLKSRRNSIAALDEEGIIPPIHDPSLNTRFSASLMLLLERYYINGELELNLIKSAYAGSKLIKTGNPRFDLLKAIYSDLFLDEKKWIESVAAGRDVILIASRFGDVNCHEDLDFFNLLRKGGYIYDELSESYFLNHYNHSKRIFDLFSELPEYLAINNPEKLIVVRPHPSENKKFWTQKNLPDNCLVTSHGDIAAWLHSGVTLVHNGCTTAVEAAFRGNRIVSFKPHTDVRYDNTDSDNLGNVCTSFEEVDSVINQKIEVFPSYEHIIYNTHEIDASKMIAESLVAMSGSAMKFKSLKYPLIFRIKRSLRKKVERVMSRETYTKSKFPGLTSQEIQLILGSIYGSRGQSVNFAIQEVGCNSFLITPH